MAHHTELERKYDADADFVLPDLRNARVEVGEPATHTLQARYFDTEDLRLAARGITLRRRQGGDDAGWHLKLPAGENTKREIQLPLGDDARAVPEELARLVTAHARGRPLVPVAEVETRRVERPLLDENGRVLAKLADDTVHAHPFGRNDGEVRLMAWREIEIEAVTASDDFLAAVGDHLLGAGAREAAARSKLARTLETVPTTTRPSATGTAGGVLVTYLAKHYEEMLASDPLVRLADHDDDSVHRMRVAVRRMRSLLRTHRRMIASARAVGLDTELKWLADTLGEVRDLEVLRARFERRLADLPDADQRPTWLAGMATEEFRARDRLRAALSAPRYLAILDSVDVFLASPPLIGERAARPARRETARTVTKAWRTMLRRHAHAAGLPAGPARDAALHRARKAAKRARYTAEAAVPALGSPAKKLARRAARLQDLLGAHHDGVVAAGRLGDLARRPGTSAVEAFAMGRLAEREERDREREPRDLPAAVKKAAARKPLRALRRA
ncbi:CYTH and CHAD domain-containing protein [Actinoallomurus purpureus]|uniref:CYTH and CHAD domain-containing protein n=1 Tax=Actinoallomurus purpureus TaxID=478114 RepID=UPI0020928F99|nr:CYTH and CHAD domain-containing protein [Actinoallomurus purpureus]MCO6011349.1 CYTH and CHAD domain-containing protein [Actinoallomurus purpureus]